MRKRTTLILAVSLLVVLMVGALSGCSLTKKKKDTFTVGWSTDTMAQPWRAYLTETIQKEWAKNSKVKLVTVEAQGKTEKQISDIEDLIAQKVDLIMASPKEEGALTAVIAKANKAGIPVVLADRGVQGDQFTTRVKMDNYVIGQAAAQYLAKKLNGKGNIVIIEGVPGATTVVETQQGFLDELKKYPNMKVLASQPADYRRDKGMQVMENYLQAYKQIDAVFSHADEMTMGALVAAKNAKREKQIVWASINATMEFIKELKDGNIVGCSPLRSNTAVVAVKVATKVLNKEKVPQVYIMPVKMVDETNAAKLYDANRYSLDPWDPEAEGLKIQTQDKASK